MTTIRNDYPAYARPDVEIVSSSQEELVGELDQSSHFGPGKVRFRVYEMSDGSVRRQVLIADAKGYFQTEYDWADQGAMESDVTGGAATKAIAKKIKTSPEKVSKALKTMYEHGDEAKKK